MSQPLDSKDTIHLSSLHVLTRILVDRTEFFDISVESHWSASISPSVSGHVSLYIFQIIPFRLLTYDYYRARLRI
jgi:hypothetical protein